MAIAPEPTTRPGPGGIPGGPDPGAATAATSNRGATNTAPNYDIQTPEQWAQSQLEYMGLPVTQNNIDFLVSWAAREGGNWNNTATYNPLNTTLQVPGSSVMSGGNSAGVQAYQSWQEGILATAQTLENYSEIMAGLQSGNALAADQNGSMANNLYQWSGHGYTSVTADTGYGSTTGGGAETGNSASNPNVPGMNDIPGLVAYIQQNDPSFAWLLQVPSVATVLEQAVANQESSTQIQAAIQQTEWWKTTSQAVKTYEENLANAPADYGPQAFNTPGSVASQTLASVKSTAAQIGITLSDSQAQTLATNFMQYGWTTQQLQAAIGSLAQYSSPSSNNAGTVSQQLQQIAAQYYMQLTPQAMQSWVQNVAGGTQSVQQFQAQMAKDAALKWTGFAPQLSQGNNMAQLTDSLRTSAAQIMEADPSQINFMTDPTYQKILDYVPPNSPDGVHRVMTQSEMAQYLKSTQPYSFTQNARDQTATLSQQIIQDFGRGT